MTVVSVAASLAASVYLAPAALAADPLSVTSLGCDSDGYGNYSCTYQISGGSAPYAGTATGSNAYSNTVTVSGQYAGVSGRCNYLHNFTVTVTIQDAAGASANSSATGWCPKWPNV